MPSISRSNNKSTIPSLKLNNSNSPLLFGSMTSRVDSRTKDLDEDYEL